MKFILDSLRLNIHEKNTCKLTALDICKQNKNEEGMMLLENFKDANTGPNGEPIIDDEGGTIIQPNVGFVLQAHYKDKIHNAYLNMTSHELVQKATAK